MSRFCNENVINVLSKVLSYNHTKYLIFNKMNLPVNVEKVNESEPVMLLSELFRFVKLKVKWYFLNYF